MHSKAVVLSKNSQMFVTNRLYLKKNNQIQFIASFSLFWLILNIVSCILMHCKHCNTFFCVHFPIWENNVLYFWNTTVTNFNLFFNRLIKRRKQITQIIIDIPNYIFSVYLHFFKKLAGNNCHLSWEQHPS